ncbi:hypothetical protein BH23ACT2_BH23ACT2_20830 [soil metagenome]
MTSDPTPRGRAASITTDQPTADDAAIELAASLLAAYGPAVCRHLAAALLLAAEGAGE